MKRGVKAKPPSLLVYLALSPPNLVHGRDELFVFFRVPRERFVLPFGDRDDFRLGSWRGAPSPHADSIRQALNGRRSQLAPLDREFLDYQMARRVEDYHGALDAMRRVVEIAPGSEFLWRAGQAAFELGRYAEAIEYLTQVDPESGWLRGWYFYWGVLTSAHHWLGEHQEELEAVRRGLRQFPNDMKLPEIRALAALGRIDELQAMLEKVEILGLYLVAADELLIHGYPEAAPKMLDRGISRQQAALSKPPGEPDWPVDGFEFAQMLFLNGRIDEARDSLERAVERVAERSDRPAPVQYMAFLGVIAGIEGDRQRALEIEQYVREQGWRREYPQFMQALWQGRIVASLGEIERANALLRPVFTGEDSENVHHQLSLPFGILSDYPAHLESMRPTASSPLPD